MAEQEQSTGPIPDPPSGDQPETIHVLLIEDNPADAYLVDIALRKSTRVPFKVTHIDNMPEADRSLQSDQQIDVILLDLNVGESRGWETFERVASHTEDRIPIVISTGLEDDGMAIRAIQAGAQDYYLKEITKFPGILSRILRYAIQRHSDKQELRTVNETLHRREAELEDALVGLKKAQLSLVEAEKMKTIGRLAAGVAHEVKNPLQIIKMGINFVSGKVADDKIAIAVIDDINTAVERATTIIGGLLDFGAPRRLEREPCQLRSVLEEAIGMVKHEVNRGNILCHYEIADEIDLVQIDRQKFVQVLLNLMINACHAMEENKGNKLKIIARKQPLSEVRSLAKDDQRIGENNKVAVVLEVIDHGPGIPEEALPKLFEPFFTTKSKSKGTGMGLCVCRMIMEMHEGGLTMRNSESGGAIAQAYWPLDET